MFGRRSMMRAVASAGLIAALAIAADSAPRTTEAATAQAVPGTFSTSVTVLNPSTNPTAATVVLDFYDAAGNKQQNAEQTTSVQPGATAFWYVPNISGLTQGQTYSAVVSSDRQVYATVNLGGVNPTTAETYNGVGTDGSVESINSTTFVPSVLKDYYGYSSTIVVQNACTAPCQATTVQIQLTGNGTSQTLTSPIPLNPNASYTFDLETTSLPAGFNGGATITNTSNYPLAVITNQYTPTMTPAQFGSTNASSGGAPQAYIPGLYNNYYGANSALIVQNVDLTNSTTVTVSYTGAKGNTIDSAAIAPGASHVFYTPNAGGKALPNGWAGSAIVTSTGQNILAQVNMNNGAGLASYGGFTAGTTKVFAPGLLKNYYGNNSALTIQNVSLTQTATVQITYSNSTVSYTRSLPPGSTLLLYTPNEVGLPNGYNGGATVISTNGVPLVGLISIQGSSPGDQMYSTNAFGSN